MTGYLFGDDLGRSSPVELDDCPPLLYEAACSAVGVDPFVRADEDCRFMQPVLVALLLARWTETDDRSPSTVLVGEGVGEIAALAAGGAISFADAVLLAAVRGRLMSRVAGSSRLASLALHQVAFHTARQLATTHELQIVRDAAPQEVVVIGPRAHAAAAAQTASKLGIDAFPPPAEHIFPAAHFATARRDWRAAVDAVHVQPLTQPVLSCTSVTPIINSRASLIQGLTRTIRLRQARVALRRVGVGQLRVITTAPVPA